VFASLPESPQGIGDIVGLAARNVRANFKQIFRYLIGPTIFATIAATGSQWAFSSGLSNVVQSKSPASEAVGLAGVWFVSLIILLGAWWILGVRLYALVRFSLGFSPTLEAANDDLWRKKFRIIGVHVLCMLLAAAVIVAFAIVSVGAAFAAGFSGANSEYGAAVSMLIVGIGVAFIGVSYPLTMNIAMCILACEEEGAVNIVARALGFVFRRLWRALAFGVIFATTWILVSYPLTLPAVLIVLGEGFVHGMAVSQGKEASGSYTPPLWTLVFSEVWTNLAWLYLRPFTAFAFGFFYYDLRMRSEGLDISRKMEAALPLHPVEMES
jgi:hypothetical protein